MVSDASPRLDLPETRGQSQGAQRRPDRGLAGEGVAAHKKGAQERGDKLAFVDESGFSLKPSIRRTWAPRGHTPLLKHRFNWKRLNAIGALVCEADGSQPDLLLTLQAETIKYDAVIGFVEDLHQQVPGRITLLIDHLPAHRHEEVQTYFDANKDWLTVEWFPAYAPELNPIECVWSSTKGKPLANLAPDRIEELERAINRAHRRVRKQPSKLQEMLVHSGLFTDEILVRPKGESQ
jgi:transposase